jgi:hypothetical protein
MKQTANRVERAFEFFVQLSPAEQLEFRAMLKGRDFASPPAQMTLPDKPPRVPGERKKRNQTGAAAAEQSSANAASV